MPFTCRCRSQLFELKRAYAFKDLGARIEFIEDVQAICTSKSKQSDFLVIGADEKTRSFVEVQNLHDFDILAKVTVNDGPTEILYQAIMSHAMRAPDPFVQVRGRWIVRRLSPHCSHIELNLLPKNRDECRLLFAMGWETANIHLGSRGALKDVRRHLDTLTRRQLESDAQAMTKAGRKDWQRWRDSGEA